MAFQAIALPQHPFNMYDAGNRQDGFCLLHHAPVNSRHVSRPSLPSHQIIPYCIRPSQGIDHLTAEFNTNDSFADEWTFTQLREQNITSQMLLAWSASIDLAESYEMFLSDIPRSLSTEETSVFQNCTSAWFGSSCRFAFNMEVIDPLDELAKYSDVMYKSFSQIVAFTLGQKGHNYEGVKVTCYEHLSCKTSLVCLDWRDICDREMDCVDGSDEQHCWQLEVNECAENEYRCHNGQCIPAEFFRDDPVDTDCLDRSDEPHEFEMNKDCDESSAFRCEEQTCRMRHEDFPCGDHQCTDGVQGCWNGRDKKPGNDFCFDAIVCEMDLTGEITGWCEEFCPDHQCLAEYCPPSFELPPHLTLFGHVHLLFVNTPIEPGHILLPAYVCYDEELCSDYLPATVYLNGSSCRHFDQLGLNDTDQYSSLAQFLDAVKDRFRGCLWTHNDTHVYSNHSTMYRCANSRKSISKHRLLDGINDCPHNDDETFNGSCSLSDTPFRLQCSIDGQQRCFAPLIIEDKKNDCDDGTDETKYRISFARICDGVDDLPPRVIDGRNETDETGCERWPCNNTYTRCDRLWSCADGADEANCPPSKCPAHQHVCVFPHRPWELACLPIARAGDGFVDCLGATDEPNFCRNQTELSRRNKFRCWNQSECSPYVILCNEKRECPLGDDEHFCQNTATVWFGICSNDRSRLTDVERFMCNANDLIVRTDIGLILSNVPTDPSRSSFAHRRIRSDGSGTLPDRSFCRHGVPIDIRMSGEATKLACLCPPGYYGDQCQHQNQRVALTVQIRMSSDWHRAFTFLAMLVDDEANIESHETIDYLSVRDCNAKFNIHLLYASRPKHPAKTFSVRIDAFDRLTLHYRASWLYAIQFPFLPIYRLATILTVPFTDVEPLKTCTVPCVHGQCLNYVNSRQVQFCRCFSGWSGARCHIKNECTCAEKALCISDSICVCPLHRYGRRCYLPQTSCQSNACLNGGQCVATDERFTSIDVSRTACICPATYFGARCEHRKSIEIDVSFGKGVSIPSSVLVHFVTVQDKGEPSRTSLLKKIHFDENSLSLHLSLIINVAFVEILGNYYIVLVREKPISSIRTAIQVFPSDRCPFIEELFGPSVSQQHLLRRIKRYHIPCAGRLDLRCFYDSTYFCLCDNERHANCFEFDQNMTYNCRGSNPCDNDGQCFLDNLQCPTQSMCICRDCYYGSKCQLSTKGGSLSLDVILAYGIRPNTQIGQQTIFVKVAIALVAIVFALGFVNSLLALMTFAMDKPREVGCGLYLLASSITSLTFIGVFVVKFSILLGAQIGSIRNRTFVRAQCTSLDFLLRVLVAGSDWLSACVAIERAVNIKRGVKFNKARSIQAAKGTIFFLFLFLVGTHLHDPIHRRLIDDEEEQRSWCVSTYSPSWQVYDWAVNIAHFLVPFVTNCISSLIVIGTAARTRSTVQKSLSYREHLREQLQQHKHILTSPLILVLLAVPRLVISFLSGCMKSGRDPWLYLIGYFISCIPPMLIAVVFVLPSQIYKQQLRDSFKQIRR